jgi:hypothetical protein
MNYIAVLLILKEISVFIRVYLWIYQILHKLYILTAMAALHVTTKPKMNPHRPTLDNAVRPLLPMHPRGTTKASASQPRTYNNNCLSVVILSLRLLLHTRHTDFLIVTNLPLETGGIKGVHENN